MSRRTIAHHISQTAFANDNSTTPSVANEVNDVNTWLIELGEIEVAHHAP